MVRNYFHRLAKMKNIFLLNFRYLYDVSDTQKRQLTYICFQDKARTLRFQPGLLKYLDRSENGDVP